MGGMCGRRTRTHAEWKVGISGAGIPRGATSSPTRRAISPAALLVNVTARTFFGCTPRTPRSQAIRCAMTRVLPLPAPASTRRGPSPAVTASRCGGFSSAGGASRASTSRLYRMPAGGFPGRAGFAPDGNLAPALAEETPSLKSRTVSPDGRSVTWRLRKGVQWHDGNPLTADDVVFTWEFAADPASAATTAGQYRLVTRVEKLDSHTVKVVFANPEPFWPIVFCGSSGAIIPKHVFEPFKGAKSREAPATLKPVGTGPYRIVDFKPGDTIRAELNPGYHRPNWPFFDRLEMKGGGDAVSAARAVIQTGEYDFAWNVQVEDDILRRMEQGGRGRVDLADSGNVEHLAPNFSDPC